MIIMALSYAQKSGDNYQINNNYALLKQWAEFLVTDSLVPGNQCVPHLTSFPRDSYD